MKIPETSANVAAYYGNEENGQWQTNGVTLEAGGGPAAGGDAGFLPLYPHPHAHPHAHAHTHTHAHARTHHDPAYIMTGAYYPGAYQPLQPLAAHAHAHPHHAPVAQPAPPPPPPHQHPPAAPDDFADYMWMENEEEFDKQVMQQLEEEALMEQCIEAMLEDERERDRRRPRANGHRVATNSSNGAPASLQEQVSRSKLNPLAAEFVPTGSRTAPPAPAPAAAPAPVAAPAPAERGGDAAPREQETDDKPVKPPTPEVSAAGCELASPEPERVAAHSDPPPDEQRQEAIETPEVSAAPAADLPESDTSVARPPPAEQHREQARSAKSATASTATSAARVDPKKAKAKPSTVRPTLDAKKRDVRRQKNSSDRTSEHRSESAMDVGHATADVDKALPRSSPSDEAPTVPKPINYAAAARANKPKKPSPAPSQPPAPADTAIQDRPSRTEKTPHAPATAPPAKINARKGSTK